MVDTDDDVVIGVLVSGSHKHLMTWLYRELMRLKQVHVAYNTSKVIQTLGGEGKSSVKAKANYIAINL